MKEFNFDKIRVSNYIHVGKDYLGKGRHRVSIILSVICKDKKERYYKIGLTADDENVKEKKAAIGRDIVNGKTIERIKEMYNLEDSDIEALMFFDKCTVVPYEEKK